MRRKPIRPRDNAVLPGPSTTLSKDTTVRQPLTRSLYSFPPEVQETVDNIRRVVNARGSANSFMGMMRLLRAFDDNHDGQLDAQEFEDFVQILCSRPPPRPSVTSVDTIGSSVSHRMLRARDKDAARQGLPTAASIEPPAPALRLPVGALRRLFDMLDRDRSGKVDASEFMRMVRPPMNERREALVRRAFGLLDGDASGVVDVAEIAERYDFSRHPDVVRGNMTAGECLRQFMATWWDADADGRITYDEFADYYEKLSVTIDDDDYFELMIRNAWRMGSASAPTASSCSTAVRAIVYHLDGTTSRVEVVNSLGLKRGDAVELIKRLKRQGVNQIKHAEVLGVRADQ
eukprot:TRINITY_DN56085_c0_g1_i1.p1 TRINITY_DN56085_c0_g1~~TRINITY_DN56085_c0_g1_i1.p1  ORF type:complete len:346 (-),score=56.39 TRINITY_DN56085_c0_g1_i1:131-1168(-)